MQEYLESGSPDQSPRTRRGLQVGAGILERVWSISSRRFVSSCKVFDGGMVLTRARR